MRYGHQDPPNPYDPPEHLPQINNMAVKDLMVFLFLTIGLGFCIGVITGVYLMR